MQEFSFVVQDLLGIHARPAGKFVKEAVLFHSNITVLLGEKSADAKKIFALMGLGVKCGNTINIKIEGDDEQEAADHLKKFIQQNW